MDVLLTDEQTMVRDTARAFLEAECPPALVRRMEKDPKGYCPDLWAKAADLGWQGIALPEAHGGSGLPLVYLGLILQEVGRHVAPMPLHASTTAALALAEAAGPDLAGAVLPGVTAGETILTFAVQETDPRLDPSAIRLTARAEGGSYVLDGAKMFVDGFPAARHVLVLARTAEPAPGREGLSLFLVDTDAAGLSEVPLVSTAKDRHSKLVFDGVRVPAARLVGPLHGGWPVAERMIDIGTALLCTQMLGAARRDVEMGVEYAKMREAFGQPIGAFQSIQHMCADMLIWIDGGDLLTFEALWKIDEGLPFQVEVSQAKSFCNEKCLAAARTSQIIHGGIGFMMDLDLHLWYRRIAAWGMRLGTSFEHRARIAKALLDHPGDVVLGQPLPGTEFVQAEPDLRHSA